MPIKRAAGSIKSYFKIWTLEKKKITVTRMDSNKKISLNFRECFFLGGLECVGHSFAYVAYFIFLRDVWIRTQRAAAAARRATNVATHLPDLANLPLN
jgi:hypothetical protein